MDYSPPFKLTSLPPELRAEVFQWLLPDCYLGLMCGMTWTYTRLYAVNKQIKLEAEEVFYDRYTVKIEVRAFGDEHVWDSRVRWEERKRSIQFDRPYIPLKIFSNRINFNRVKRCSIEVPRMLFSCDMDLHQEHFLVKTTRCMGSVVELLHRSKALNKLKLNIRIENIGFCPRTEDEMRRISATMYGAAKEAIEALAGQLGNLRGLKHADLTCTFGGFGIIHHPPPPADCLWFQAYQESWKTWLTHPTPEQTNTATSQYLFSRLFANACRIVDDTNSFYNRPDLGEIFLLFENECGKPLPEKEEFKSLLRDAKDAKAREDAGRLRELNHGLYQLEQDWIRQRSTMLQSCLERLCSNEAQNRQARFDFFHLE